MAVYRAIYLSFWTDEKVDEDFSPEDKYFMLYALSNPHTRLCGCYGITIKQISQEMGYSRAKIEEIINAEVCPPLEKKGICRNCSYFDFCYSGEEDEK